MLWRQWYPKVRCNLLASSWRRVHRQIESARPRKFNICRLPPHCNEDASLLIAYMAPPNELMHLLLHFLPPADINECERDPCKNGGICTDLVANYSCECPGEYMGRNCQYSKCSSSSFTTIFPWVIRPLCVQTAVQRRGNGVGRLFRRINAALHLIFSCEMVFLHLFFWLQMIKRSCKDFGIITEGCCFFSFWIHCKYFVMLQAF